MKTLTYVVVRGREKGVVLTPHNKGDDGKYVASPTRFKKDYVKVDKVEDLIPLMRKGYGVRMSNQDSDNHRMPSLIQPQGIKIFDMG
jgi:hypothetical protein